MIFIYIELCPLEYYVTDPNHSYCSQPYPGVVDQPVSSAARIKILEMHNYQRRLVRGTNMEKMVYKVFLINIYT